MIQVESALLCVLVAFFDSQLVTLQMPSILGVLIIFKKPIGLAYLKGIHGVGLFGICIGMIKSACITGYMIYYAVKLLNPDAEGAIIKKQPRQEFFPLFHLEDFEDVKDAFVALVFLFMFMIILLELLYWK